MLEAICFQTREVLDAMHADADACKLQMSLLALRVDGGASCNNLLMQMQADILGTPVVRPVDVETTALGAALAAGVTLDLWSSDVLFAPHQPRKGAIEFAPAGVQSEREARYTRWKSAVARSLCWTSEPPHIPADGRERDATALAPRTRTDWSHVAGGVALGVALGAVLAARWHGATSRA